MFLNAYMIHRGQGNPKPHDVHRSLMRLTFSQAGRERLGSSVNPVMGPVIAPLWVEQGSMKLSFPEVVDTAAYQSIPASSNAGSDTGHDSQETPTANPLEEAQLQSAILQSQLEHESQLEHAPQDGPDDLLNTLIPDDLENTLIPDATTFEIIGTDRIDGQ